MDLQTVQSTVLRNGKYALVGGYLSVVPKTVVFSRAVNMATIGDQLTAITYDDAYTGVGSYTDVIEDAEIVVYDGNTDTVKGRLRVAYGGATSTVIQVKEVSKGELEVADNDRFEVWDEYRLRAKLVGATDTFPKDSRREYVDEGEDPAPNVICGGAIVGWVDSAGILESTIDADDSHPMDLASSSVSFVLDPADGTITSNAGDATLSPFTVEFDVSNGVFRHATLTVTDDDNSKTTTRKIPVWTHDASDPPINVYRASLNFDRARGDWSAQLTLDGDDATIDLLRDGAYCVYWEVERYDGTEASYGNPFTGRSNIKFAGFLRRDTITVNPDNDTLTIEAVSPLGKLGELPGFSQVLDYAGTPTTWQQDIAPTLNKLTWYVWHYHTNASLYFDWVKLSTDYVFPNFAVQQDTLSAQMREVVAGVSGIVTCDQTGRFLTRRNLQRATTTERNAADTVLALTTADITEITNWAVEHAYQYNSLLLKMLTVGGDPMLSIAPGEAPAEAPDRTSFERAIGIDQDEANFITGVAWAELNSLYNGLPVERGFACKPHPGYGVVDPAYDQWLTVTLPASTNRRGRSLSGDRFIMTRVSIDADPVSGLKDISWVMDHETFGADGVTRVVMTGDETPIPYIPYYPPTPTIPGTLPGLIARGTANMALICVSGLVLTETFQASSPVYESTAWATLSVAGTVKLWVPDGYAPGEGWLFTTTKIYRLVLATGDATELHSWSTTITSVSADASISEEGFVCAVAYIQGTGTIAAYSTDGATFTEVVLNAAYATDGASFGIHAGCRIPSISAGTVYTSIYTTTGSIGSSTVVSAGRVSTDYGATWSAWTVIAADTDVLAQQIFTPFPTPNVFIYNNLRTLNHNMIRVTNGTPVDISPTISSESFGVVGSRDGISASPQIPTRMLLVGQEDNGGQYAVFLTNDGASNWTNIVAKGTAARHCAIAGNDPNVAWVWGTSNVIAQLAISGNSATLVSKAGNLSSLSAGDIIAIAGV